MREVRNRIIQLQDHLGQAAGVDPLQDRYHAGYILACMDFLNVDFEE